MKVENGESKVESWKLKIDSFLFRFLAWFHGFNYLAGLFELAEREKDTGMIKATRDELLENYYRTMDWVRRKHGVDTDYVRTLRVELYPN
ncbi:MAG: hypothetical protein ABI760_12280 [Ferruginibacter sp.]